MAFRAILYGLCAAALLLFAQGRAHAQSIAFLRDAEMEAFLRQISDPIFVAAELDPRAVNMYIVNDPSLNAFVAAGQNVFIHTGLFLRAEHVDQLRGVIAHETCHIACGHRVRTNNAIGNAGNISILSMVLGAAAIALGAGQAGIGILGAGQRAATGQFLAYSRSQEGEADIAAARYLDATETSGVGLIEFFETLRDQEILAHVRQDPYVRSHPLTSTRISQLRELVAASPYHLREPDAALNAQFNRLKAKLFGFQNAPRQTLRKYPPSDTSVDARYARVYAYHKALEWDLALEEADALIALEPENPFFHEIKGQILFENHKIAEAVEVFAHAMSLAPRNALIIAAYGQALVAQDDTAKMQEAIPVLLRATEIEPGNTFAWFNLARAYSFIGNEPMANLATAERFYGAGAAAQAYRHARRAVDQLPNGSPEWIRAQDIVFATESFVENERRQRVQKRPPSR